MYINYWNFILYIHINMLFIKFLRQLKILQKLLIILKQSILNLLYFLAIDCKHIQRLK